MYIHLGNNVVISSKSLIAILNIEPPVAEDLQDIIYSVKSSQKAVNISDKGKEKALILTDDKAYFSPISSTTLYKRGLNYFKEGLIIEKSK
jgi:PHD/YefM family antitoxin component YafN of YafNO toxin-antitoxin module